MTYCGESFELAPGKSKTFTYSYKVTKEDVEAGSIVNVVKANATAARGSDPDEVEATATVKTVKNQFTFDERVLRKTKQKAGDGLCEACEIIPGLGFVFTAFLCQVTRAIMKHCGPSTIFIPTYSIVSETKCLKKIN